LDRSESPLPKMVDKKSLRSSKRSDDNDKNTGSSSSNNNNPSKSTRASSRRTGSGSTAKKAATEKTDKKQMPANDKKPEPPVDDVQMTDVQEAKKDASGDVEMGDDAKTSEGDKKDDETTEEEKEDPVVTIANGAFPLPPTTVSIDRETDCLTCRNQTELHPARTCRYSFRFPLHFTGSPIDSFAAPQSHPRDHREGCSGILSIRTLISLTFARCDWTS